MLKVKDYNIGDTEALYNLGKALSSPVRIEMLRHLYGKSLIIGEIAKEMDLPASSAAFHLKILEKAGLIRMEEQPGTRGTTKMCNRKIDLLTIDLIKGNNDPDIHNVANMEMPVGAYTDCQVTPTCGLWCEDGAIGQEEDMVRRFYYPEHVRAGILWTSSGYVEYKFPNEVPQQACPKRLTFAGEICSEAPGYREEWMSDITVWINGVDCGTWTSPGDLGARRGRLNPPSVQNGSTQYGIWVTWAVDGEGCRVNGELVGDTKIEDLHLMEESFVRVRLGNRPDARYVGGFNLFGRHFGDYDQDLVLTVEY